MHNKVIIDFDKIKLIIWDMDDTFWKGTLSEGSIEPIDRNIDLVKKATACGVVNSICSKNDQKQVIGELCKEGIADYFVFPSTDWSPKGQRIAQIITNMGLRPVNVLFIDDNIQNIEEACFYADGLLVATPDILQKLYSYFDTRSAEDTGHKRLNQYKVLEKKIKAKNNYSDNLDFLYSTHTQVDILYDCMPEIERIHELLLRSNQLNYTKIRPTREQLKNIINDNDIKTGYVHVRDKFGDYGIVGFFAIDKDVCIHFVFSCRAIGQGIEQYVYATLGYPQLKIIEPVVSYVDRSSVPGWINMADVPKQQDMSNKILPVNTSCLLFKGPCDLTLICSYLERGNHIITEFTYVGKKGNSIEQHNHSQHLIQLPFLNEVQKRQILTECLFADNQMFNTSLFDENIDIIFFSTLPEMHLGIYKRKDDGTQVIFGEWCYPLTDSNVHKQLIDGTVYTGGVKFNKKYLDEFSSKYEFIGRLSPQQSAQNIARIREMINPLSTLVLILGLESPYEANTSKAYENRHKEHKQLNDLLRKMADSDSRIKLLDLNSFVDSQQDFTNNINHFTKKVYYDAAREVMRIVAENSSVKINCKKGYQLFIDQCAYKVRKLITPQSLLYEIMRKIYNRIK